VFHAVMTKPGGLLFCAIIYVSTFTIVTGTYSMYVGVCCMMIRCKWCHCWGWRVPRPMLATCSPLLSSCHRQTARYSRWLISFSRHSRNL